MSRNAYKWRLRTVNHRQKYGATTMPKKKAKKDPGCKELKMNLGITYRMEEAKKFVGNKGEIVKLLTDEGDWDDSEPEGGRYFYVYKTDGKFTTAEFLRIFANVDNTDVMSTNDDHLPQNLKLISDRFCDLTIGEMETFVSNWNAHNRQELLDFFDTTFGIGKGAMARRLE